MLLEGSNVSTALTWVRPDLDKHLDQIRTKIEHIASSAHIGDGIERTSEHLVQLKYTFEALVLQGATLVVDEMITVCDELLRCSVRDRQKAFGALMDAIVVIPSYLDRLQAGHHDLPVLLLPIVNELRSSYNANIVSEATLFTPDLDIALPEPEEDNGHATATDESDPEFAQRMCRQWENALLSWLQHQRDTEKLSPLHTVSETMRRRSERSDLRRLWWIAAEVIGGLLDGVTDNDVHLRRLFARLHLVLKTLAEGGEEACKAPAVDAVSQALLFHIAQARTGSTGVDDLRERFQLQELVPDRDVLVRARGAVSGRNRELYVSLGAAVRDELSLVKDALDLELRTGEIEPIRRKQSHEALLRLQDTLKMMGLGDSAQSIEALMPAFEASEESATDEDQGSRESLLLSLAGQLIQVESVLEEQITTLGEPLLEDQATSFIDLPIHEQRRIHSHLLDETVVSLHQAQDGVRRHLDGDLKADFISPMDHIAGALELVGQSETADLTYKLRNALANLLRVSRSEAEADPAKLESAADAVAALELYLAGCRDQQSNRDRFLEVLKDRLDHLPVGEMEAVEPVVTAKAEPADEAGIAPESELDPELLAVFLEEYESVAAMLDEQVPRWVQNPADLALLTEIRRGFHTLKGSGRMVGANELGDFAWHIEELLNTYLEGNITATDNAVVMLSLADALLPAMKQRLVQEPSELDAAAIAAVAEQASKLVAGENADWAMLADLLPAAFAGLLKGHKDDAPDPDTAAEEPSLQELLCRELADSLAVLKPLVDQISRDRNSTADEAQLTAIHNIAGTTALDPLGKEPEVAKSLEALLVAQQQSGKAFDDTSMWAVATSLAYFDTCLSIHEGDADAELGDDEDAQIAQLNKLTAEIKAAGETLTDSQRDIETEPGETITETPAAAEQAETATEPDSSDEQVETEEASETDAVSEAGEDDLEDSESVDTEILNIFLEEATDILERCDSLLNNWRDDLPDLDIVQNLQREIHTFKGGARMSGLTSLGNLSHSMETLLERIAGGLLPPSLSAIDVLEQGCDRLSSWAEKAGTGVLPSANQALELFEQQVEALTAVPVQPAASVADSASIDTEPAELQDIPDVEVPVEEAPEAIAEPSEEPTVSQQIRVNADLLDSLVNSAGEISIFRSRLEQQVGHMRDNLKEFDETISRLREQFRKLEIETETQIGSHYQQAPEPASEEFDPLEMDRFSSIQQLSRSLSESVSDLLNLQELLDESARKSEALLVQQSRVSSDLQEGLMQTRMVPFGTIAPRLRRIIRSAASETGKKARLQLRMTTGGDQLDRNVLERITAPLEHLLRNSIVHGIEKPAERRKLNKPEEGELCITVAAEATEFVVRVEDDGAGLNIEAIRKRAIELDLIEKDANPPTQQLLQLILHSGFSTSKKVTKLAGRGVGMDVVSSEIKQIGGSVEIDSEEGKFSRFTIRIPFTLAVMQAIGVVAGEHRYLIPVASVAGVARVMPADYQALLEQENPAYEFAGEPYSILDLEPLLGEPSTPLGDETVSILMIKSGNQLAAFRVPELLGHSEIVIKPVGPHISSVPGILGGTITGDGQVVIIIDAGPLIRQARLTGARPAPPMENIDFHLQKTLALVVDDSITMRKVTTRVLEGNDFEVITARDGVDAVEQMRERVPDVLLLDVEMPRMDGYQVAEHVRADARLRHIPIIMITSRAGSKHRERGKKAGANAYLSKPYKESALLFEVEKLLNPEAEDNA